MVVSNSDRWPARYLPICLMTVLRNAISGAKEEDDGCTSSDKEHSQLPTMGCDREGKGESKWLLLLGA